MPAKRTIKGQPIPEEVAHQIPYGMTDQGIAEANSAPQKVKRISRVVRDAKFEQKLARMERELEMGVDPFMEVIEEQRTENDERLANTDDEFRFISDRVVQRRGMRGWEVVKDEKGDPIKVAGLTLAAMPKEIAQIRTEKYRRQGVERLSHAQDQLVESQERLIAQSRAEGLSPLRTGDRFTEDERDPSRSVPVGISSHRGGDAHVG